MTPTETDWKRFWMKVEKTKSCWNWTGVRSPTGYGVFYFAGKTHRVHRVTMAATLGKLTPGLVVDHVCRNRACVNPSHLREVTQRDNALARVARLENQLHTAVNYLMQAKAQFALHTDNSFVDTFIEDYIKARSEGEEE